MNRTRLSRGLAFLALASSAGCVLLDALGARAGLAFSHRLHVTEEELDCVSCHETAAVAAEPGMPSLDACQACHETIDAEKPPERAIASLFDENGTYRAAGASALEEEVVFEHLAHVKALGDCGACHVGIEENTAIGRAERVDMDACTACHEERSVVSECATCHTLVGVDQPPENHAHDWEHLHGRRSRLSAPEPADRCFLCHEETTCASCHALEPPDDHDAFFRLRGHGFRARLDRSNCAACHESFSCDRCHEDVLPLNHTGMWGSPKDTHCLTCHFPLAASGCSTCHLGTPSHALAPPKPSWHNAAMNCRMCHIATLPLSHVDDGTNCNFCHP
jgi:hypothetical protein